MVTITALLTRSLRAIAISQDYFTASKIALEGMEMMRTIRNNNLIASRPDTDGNTANDIVWDTGIAPATPGTITYEFDYQTIENYTPGATTLPTLGSSARRLCIGTATTNAGRYTYDNSANNCTGSNTAPLQGNFTRTITVSDPDLTDPWLQVTVTVSSGSLDNDYVLSTMLYNAS